jgi:hypothetical protein
MCRGVFFAKEHKRAVFADRTRKSRQTTKDFRKDFMSSRHSRRQQVFHRVAVSSLRSHQEVIQPFSIPHAQEDVKRITEEIDFREMADGSLVEMIESSNEPGRYLFATYKAKEVACADKVEEGNRVFVPLPKNSEVCRYVNFPKGASEFTSVGDLLAGIWACSSLLLN